MKFTEMRHTAALAIVLAACPASMAMAQSADVSANANAGLTLVAQHQTYLDVMANLEAAGYSVVETKTTFLGRVQITARNAAHLREVVVSRATGEVKSDVIVETFATGDAAAAAVVGVAPAAGAPEEGFSILEILGLGSTSTEAVSGTAGSVTDGANSVAGSVSGAVSGVTSGIGGLGVSGGVGGGASASGNGSGGGGLGGGLGL